MKNIKTATLLFLLMCFAGGKAYAQSTDEKGTLLEKIKDSISADPDNLRLHEAYLKASGFTKWGAPEDPAFIAQYEEWMKEFPNEAAIPYALGHAYAGKESPKAKPYLLKAVALDPKMDKAYFDLWLDAERWGEFQKGREYIGKASQIKPDDPNYAFYYASGFDKSDPEKYRELSLKVAERFPDSERGAQALYWLATRNNDVAQKVKYYEMLKSKYPPSKFGWSSSGMSGYFDVLLKQNPEKAEALASEMAAGSTQERDQKTWKANIAMANDFKQINELIQQGSGKEALAVIDRVKLSRWSNAKNQLLLLKAQALKLAGNEEKAYGELKYAYAISPEPEIGDALAQYGKALGKDQNDINRDVWYIRDTMAKPATPFSLKQYFKDGKLSLADLEGKVVLLTYWFPGCGPCRGEFPHFQNVVNKFKGQDLAYIGINIVPEQNDYVIPFMKSSGYTFLPLEDVEGRDKGNLDNGGAAPVNFLIDKHGRIVFKNIRTDGSNEDVLESMIRSLLNQS